MSRRARLLGWMILVASCVLWAAVVLGREAVRRYRSFLNPRNWFGGKRR